jgi:hypothetical protein
MLTGVALAETLPQTKPDDRLVLADQPAPGGDMNLYRCVAALIGFTAIALQYWLVMTGDTGPDPLNRTINFFSYFTILTNLLVALALLTPAIAPRSGIGSFFRRADARTALAAYILVVGIIYHLILRDLWAPEGLAWYVDMTLHYVMPALYLIDWLFFSVKADVTWAVGRKALFYPIAYMAWTLVHGEATKFYPYPFVDVSELGLQQVLIHGAGLLVVFAVLSLAFAAIAKGIVRMAGDDDAAPVIAAA